ncbi:flavodoxin family protein [Gymnodinialimonas ceratoperidinii]|uniref:Flavodoxin family protein n=1 Tax=Gymnodinialimonas ceratoperidinii TaxID=2856823 RepID=A0A8F6TVK9_9RHOB|nr:flavodoxin family protein [Gymnodinialimonas ceratoperidinii]QXT39268.1 flavodoxin family protein [Gymnodinialimonas ceratoperidinii]
MIAIAYFSGAGHTALLARAIAEGAGGAHLIDVTAMTAEDWTALDAATAIVLGAPTYMGSTAARFDLFLEQASDPRWETGAWRDKLAGGFTVACHGSGDKGVALQRLSTFAAQMGMIWVGQSEIGAPVYPDRPGINRDGSWIGLMATQVIGEADILDTGDLETARLYGARLAASARRWAMGAPD